MNTWIQNYTQHKYMWVKDSGWYQIDYNYAERYTWGQSQGCSFINDECISTSTQTSNFPQFWCDSDDGLIGCTADYSSIGACMTFGPSAHDYCTFMYVIGVHIQSPSVSKGFYTPYLW